MATLQNTDLFVVQRPAGGQAGTYKLKWEEVLSNINAQGGSSFKGVANFTDINDDPAPNRTNGDQYINSTDGVFAWTNPSAPDIDVLEGDSCFWSQDDGVWYVISSGGGGGGAVSSVDATAPLLMESGATVGDVIVESREASTTQSGHVNRLATAADVVSGTTNAVVTANLLKDANDDSTLQAVTDRGNNTTNNITLNTNKITLNATNGSATFADGDIVLTDTGTIDSTSAAYSFIGRSPDGTAVFAVAANKQLVNIGEITGDESNIKFDGTDGSAEFAGKVTSASTEDTDSGTTLVTKDYIDGAVSGAGYWNRTSGVLSPGEITDDVRIGGSPVITGIQTLSDLVRMLSAEEQELYQDDIYALNLTHPFVSIAALTGVSAEFKLALERVTTAGNINLNSDGTASFAPGTDKSLKTEVIAVGTGGGIVTGVVEVQGNLAGTNTAFSVRPTDVASTPTVTIKTDGSASFAREITVGPSAAINSRQRYLSIGANNIDVGAQSDYSQVYYTTDNSVIYGFKTDGSAEFAGTIQAGGYDFTNLDPLP